MKIKYEWELIQPKDFNYPNSRVKVIGGWLVNCYYQFAHYPDQFGLTMTTTFVPDPNHEWEIEN